MTDEDVERELRRMRIELLIAMVIGVAALVAVACMAGAR